MSDIELIEYEKVAYVKEMEAYLHSLKQLSENEAKKVAKENLMRCNIIQENGEFTEHYKFSRINA